MARIIVETEQGESGGARVVMDEHVVPVHLETERGAAQFAERVAWAVQDAAETEDRDS